MKTVHALLLGVMVVASLGLWGCTQQQTGAITVKVRDLETRYAKLEEDYRALQSSNEQNKKRLAQSESLRATLEEQKTDLTKQLDSTTEQRDDLRKQVALRTTERDAAQTNLVQFSKELMALAGRIEVAANSPTTSPNLTIVPVSRRSE
jgi:outer membrane murein-binding lipoprotein Lpp